MTTAEPVEIQLYPIMSPDSYGRKVIAMAYDFDQLASTHVLHQDYSLHKSNRSAYHAPKPLPKPTPKWPKRDPRMTFILGMRCSDGLVLCSDSLESDGVTKRYRGKLHTIVCGDWGICWGASGSAFSCDKFGDKLKELITKRDEYNRAAIENDAEVCLEFIRQSYAQTQSISVVIGLFGQPTKKDQDGKPFLGAPEFFLYRGSSEASCLSPVRDYAMVGMDVTLAGFMLSNTYHPFMPTVHGIRLGVFITSLMKHHADGVGGDTGCMYYEIGNRFAPLLDREIQDIEKRFPLTSLDEAVARYWLDFDENRNLDELTRAHLNHKLAKGYIDKKIEDIKRSDAQKSEDRQ